MQQRTDVMEMLAARVPLTLAIDLLDSDGPNSTRIYRDERPSPAQMEWLNA